MDLLNILLRSSNVRGFVEQSVDKVDPKLIDSELLPLWNMLNDSNKNTISSHAEMLLKRH